MRTYLLMYLAIAQLAIAPLLSLAWPAFRSRYLASPRWMLIQLGVALLALVVLAVVQR